MARLVVAVLVLAAVAVAPAAGAPEQRRNAAALSSSGTPALSPRARRRCS